MRSEQKIVAMAKERGVGIWPVSPLFAEGSKFRQEKCAGFVLGYASLKKSDIDQGIRLLADVIRDHLAKDTELPD
jgi:GntR family transcriptional regulator/MocR family aminotransferase